jgi:AraC-like DNA-binding protein
MAPNIELGEGMTGMITAAIAPSVPPALAAMVGTQAMQGCSAMLPTAVARLRVWHSAGPTAPVPAMFEPKFYLILQGEKRMTIGGATRHFAPGHCAVSTLGLPFTSEVTQATPDVPYIGIEIELDPGLVGSVLLDSRDRARNASADGDHAQTPAFAEMQADGDLLDTVGRLLRLLDTPADIPALAPLFERELLYRLARSPLGPALYQLLGSKRFAQVRTAVEWIRAHAHDAMCVPTLAASVGMSTTSFHRHFKAVTATSPLAYQRHVRLLDARRRLAAGASDVTVAAFACGYASASQFSREYKRMFGVPPVRDVLRPARRA